MDVLCMAYFQQLEAPPEAVLLPVFDRPSVPHAESLEAWLPFGAAFSV
ncbi:hypothethical protein [Ralstonia solanacearum PSI07]|nr:hypothethical protein [Ralstonia solanacearum PSI07]